jgi:hypothetical protein
MQIKIIATIVALSIGGSATSYAASYTPQTPAYGSMQPAPRGNPDRSYAFQNALPAEAAKPAMVAPRMTVPQTAPSPNDFNWLVGGGG